MGSQVGLRFWRRFRLRLAIFWFWLFSLVVVTFIYRRFFKILCRFYTKPRLSKCGFVTCVLINNIFSDEGGYK